MQQIISPDGTSFKKPKLDYIFKTFTIYSFLYIYEGEDS